MPTVLEARERARLIRKRTAMETVSPTALPGVALRLMEPMA